MAVNDVWECVFNYRDGQSAAQMVRHYRVAVEESETQTELTDALAVKLGALATDLIEVTSTASAALVCITSHRVIGGASRVFATFFGAANGAATGEANSAQLAILVSLYTNNITPSGRGRMYIPFPAESVSEGGVILNTVADDIVAKVDPMLTHFTDAAQNEYDPVVYSRETTSAAGIDSRVLRPVLATQRRRRVNLQPFAS